MKKRVFVLLIVFCAVLLLTSCSDKSAEHSFFAFDTYNEIKISSNNYDDLKEAESLCRNLDLTFSKYDKDSELFFINANGGGICSEELLDILNTSFNISTKSNGYFNPVLGKLVSLWNIGKEDFCLPDHSRVADAISVSDLSLVKMNGSEIVLNGCEIDLGAIAKGHAAEKVCTLLNNGNSEWGIVNLGGNIGVFSNNGNKVFKIGIRDPNTANSIIGYVEISNGYISVSGSYERYSEINGTVYSHVIDPFTGYPVNTDLKTACVVDDNGAECDAMSTALLAMGSDIAIEYIKHHNINAILLLNDNTLFVSDTLKESFHNTNEK